MNNKKGYTRDTWEQDISPEAFETLRVLGNFNALIDARASDREIKGYLNESKTYFDSDELRKMSAHLIEVADWLDERARRQANVEATQS